MSFGRSVLWVVGFPAVFWAQSEGRRILLILIMKFLSLIKFGSAVLVIQEFFSGIPDLTKIGFS